MVFEPTSLPAFHITRVPLKYFHHQAFCIGCGTVGRATALDFLSGCSLHLFYLRVAQNKHWSREGLLSDKIWSKTNKVNRIHCRGGGEVAEWSKALLVREKINEKTKRSLVQPPAWAILKTTRIHCVPCLTTLIVRTGGKTCLTAALSVWRSPPGTLAATRPSGPRWSSACSWCSWRGWRISASSEFRRSWNWKSLKMMEIKNNQPLVFLPRLR